MPDTPPAVRFAQLEVGERFRFLSGWTMPFCGSPKGECQKVSAARYAFTAAPHRVYRVPAVSAEVVRVPAGAARAQS